MTETVILLGGPLSGTLVEGVGDDVGGLIFERAPRDLSLAGGKPMKIGTISYVYKRTDRRRIVPNNPQEEALINGGFHTIPIFQIDWHEMTCDHQWEMALQ